MESAMGRGFVGHWGVAADRSAGGFPVTWEWEPMAMAMVACNDRNRLGEQL